MLSLIPGKRLSNIDTDTQLQGQCQETAHSNAIRHLEDVWELRIFRESGSQQTQRGEIIFEGTFLFLSLFFKSLVRWVSDNYHFILI